ncbi:MAG TPA: MDR family oxidoreductase [Pedomonas sp.]|uniref:acrylyl-CoA reductase (NADPH) n=1 Tax=Pedomonas sp. TaxID=2976421 RepID=UPI002F426CDA
MSGNADDQFQALMLTKDGAAMKADLVTLGEDALMEGDVVVDVSHSCMNYKDGLAITGAAPIARTFPMIPGIDLAGRVRSSAHPDFKPGDAVVLNGYGLGETHYGGYASRARVHGKWLVPLENITPFEAMAIGTAGYTAMLCVMALERHGVHQTEGQVLVTGAAGGVGSVAISLLCALGYSVAASTGRPEEADYLKSLGADEIIDRNELAGPGKPLGKERWIGAIDTVGSYTLANVLAQTRYGGCVAACGLAQGADLPVTVMPFILRSVTLAGVDSVQAPMGLRREAWLRLDQLIDREKLKTMTRTVQLADVPALAPDFLAGKVKGRVVVEMH